MLNEKARNLQLQLKNLSKSLGLEVMEVKGGETFKVENEDLLNRFDPEFYYYKYKIPEVLKPSQ